MNVMESIREFFLGPRQEPEPTYPKQGQGEYYQGTETTAVEAQVTPKELNPIPVDVAGIVPVWALPTKKQEIRQSNVNGIVPAILVEGHYKVKRVVMWAFVGGLFVGRETDIKTTSAAGPQGVQLPQGFPVVMEGCTEKLWYVQNQASVTANGAQPIHYVVEYWAD